MAWSIQSSSVKAALTIPAYWILISTSVSSQCFGSYSNHLSSPLIEFLSKAPQPAQSRQKHDRDMF
jgi:hypothetical protein